MAHGREENALGFTGGLRGLLRGLQLLYCIAALRNIATAPHSHGTFTIQELRLGVPLKESTILELNHIIRRVIAIYQELECADQESSGILELWSGNHQGLHTVGGLQAFLRNSPHGLKFAVVGESAAPAVHNQNAIGCRFQSRANHCRALPDPPTQASAPSQGHEDSQNHERPT